MLVHKLAELIDALQALVQSRSIHRLWKGLLLSTIDNNLNLGVDWTLGK